MGAAALLRYAFSLSVAAAILVGCGASQPPIGAPVAPAMHANLSSPPQYATSKKFEYVINYYGTYASIFDYPKSDQQVGSIANVGGQGCTNVLYGYGKKIIWIVASDTDIAEFEVPKKQIKTLTDSVGQPSSCAMNTSGDLAVGILANGDIDIFKNASGSGTVMSTPLVAEFFDGYDNKGNLFFDGYTARHAFELVELPAGSTKLKPIKTSNAVSTPGSVQWDGKFLTVLDQARSAIYQYTVKGTKATLKGTVYLTGASDCAQTWIATGVIFCGDAGYGDAEVFNYPAGGSPIATFTGNFDLPLGVVAAEN